jgi:dTDP-4-dehydrorhamnose 3,5-epimerase-like enzyme
MNNYKTIEFQPHGDDTGKLISLEKEVNIPFDFKRIYYIYDTKKTIQRGFHAHINLKQVIVSLSGSCVFVLDDGAQRKEITLDSPTSGILIQGLIWREMKNFSDDCVLVVLASEYYDTDDYIYDYKTFLRKVNERK